MYRRKEKDIRLDRARQLYQRGYFLLRWEGDVAVCSSLFPDDSVEIGRLREYRFSLIPSKDEINQHTLGG